MKTTKIFMIAAVAALLATACGKDNGRIRILAEDMNTAGGAKVLVDTTNVSAGATWVAGETININGSAYPIVVEDENFYIDARTDGPTGTLYAVYPATTTSGGNDIVVVNGNGSATNVTLSRLAVNFSSDYTKHSVVFPMAAKAADGSASLLFNHLTGGFKLRLKAATANVDIYTFKVVVQSTDAPQAVTLDGVDYTTAWKVNGPTMPDDTLGQRTGDINVMYSSEMLFDFKHGGDNYARVGASGLTVCLPVPVCTARRLTISGYDNSGNQLFVATKELGTVDVERNTMYTIPTIQIN